VKNTITLLTAALIGLAFGGVGFVQTKPGAPATPSATGRKAGTSESAKGQATVLTGKVMAVDAKAGKITVKVKEEEIQLIADSKGTKAALQKLKVGDVAKVFARDGKVIAASPVKAEANTAPK
jgi:Cu/Ag efflux protein CusF